MDTITPQGSGGPDPRDAPGAQSDIPGMLRGVIDAVIQLGQARVELASAEMRAEVESRIRRLLLALVPLCFILTALGLLNLGLVAWLAEGVGPVVASFVLAGAYGGIGLIWLLWWRASGGLNPRGARPDGDTDSDPEGGTTR